MQRFWAPIARVFKLFSPSPATRLVWLGGCALLLWAANASAGQASLAWDAVSAPNLSGYRLYYGQTSHTYTAHIDVGLQTTATVPGLTVGQTYYFAVTAFDSTGQESPFSNEVSATITAPAPVANFSANPTSGQPPLTVAFTDASTGSITAWLWNFGDSTSSSLQSPTHTYATAGTYTVQLTVTGPGGSNTATKTGYITVTAPPPVAKFSASPTSGQAPVAVTFSDASTGSITARLWNFGDGTSSTLQSPTHTYTIAGTYTVQLTVTGPGGSTTATGSITVTAPPLVANFSASPTSGQAPLKVTFTDTSTGSVTGWVWNFGDGTRSTLQSPTHTYTAAGTYTVQLTVTGSKRSIKSTKTGSITVTAPVSTTGQVNLAWDAVSAPNLSGYRLYYGQISHTYTAHLDVGLQTTATVPGLTVGQTYYFAVTAFDSTGQESPFSNEVSATIAAAATAIVGASSTSPTSTSNTATKTTSSTATPSMSPPITYVSASQTRGPTPAAVTSTAASFSATPTRGRLPLTVAFSDASTGSMTAWAWDFGDGTRSTLQSPTHTYTTAGTYTVQLTVTGPESSHIATKTSYITVTPALLEVGDLTIDSGWQRVPFRQTFVDPIVVATPLSANDVTLATVQIRNVEPTGFEIRLQAADELPGRHAAETVSYLAMERGPHLLGTGIRVEAGRLTMTETPSQLFTPVTFNQAFGVAPVVVTSVTSDNDDTAVTTRMRNVTPTGFHVAMQEQMSTTHSPATETIDYIAWEPSSGTVDGLTFEVYTTPNAVTDTLYTLQWTEHFLAIPMLLATMQMTNNEKPTVLRLDDKDPVEGQIYIEGAASANDDLHYVPEVVGYMAFTYQ